MTECDGAEANLSLLKDLASDYDNHNEKVFAEAQARIDAGDASADDTSLPRNLMLLIYVLCMIH